MTPTSVPDGTRRDQQGAGPRPTGRGAGAADGRAARGRRRNTVFVIAGLFTAFVLAGFVSGYASSKPDGLEKVAADEGFADQADDHAFADWPLAGYAVSGIDDERLAGGVAGVIGVTITFVVGGVLLGAVLRLRSRSDRPASGPRSGSSSGPSSASADGVSSASGA